MQFVGCKLHTISLNKQPWRAGELVISLTLICLVRFYLCQPYIAETKAISLIICHMCFLIEHRWLLSLLSIISHLYLWQQMTMSMGTCIMFFKYHYASKFRSTSTLLMIFQKFIFLKLLLRLNSPFLPATLFRILFIRLNFTLPRSVSWLILVGLLWTIYYLGWKNK